MPTESSVMASVRKALSRLGVITWRNNTGCLPDKHGRPVRFGLCKGSSDLIGFTPVEIPGYGTVAVFTAIECKKPGGCPTAEQVNFINRVRQGGGIAGVACSKEDAEWIVSEHLKKAYGHTR